MNEHSSQGTTQLSWYQFLFCWLFFCYCLLLLVNPALVHPLVHLQLPYGEYFSPTLTALSVYLQTSSPTECLLFQISSLVSLLFFFHIIIRNRINSTAPYSSPFWTPFWTIDTIAFFITSATIMHHLHLTPAFLLGLSSLGFTIALPTQDSSQPTTTGSEVSATISSVSETVNAVETVVLLGIPKLTPDNSCGKAGNGKNKGYTCDPKSTKGGACCSEFVSPAICLRSDISTHC
jgi:hypothetical protein